MASDLFHPLDLVAGEADGSRGLIERAHISGPNLGDQGIIPLEDLRGLVSFDGFILAGIHLNDEL
jgi:hypothetical protein